jgi:hypothetical protein
VSFQSIFDDFVARADLESMKDAAVLIGDGCSTDGFVDFRRWLISAGRRVYSAAIWDPDTLAAVEFGRGADEPDCFFEDFGYVAGEVYKQLTGKRLPYTVPSLEQLEQSVERLESRPRRPPTALPRLRMKYGEAVETNSEP